MIYIYSRNTHLRQDFPRPPGERRLRRRWKKKINWAPWASQEGSPSAPFWGTCGAPNGFKNLTRSMRIRNMCLVLKLDNGKVVSIANGQIDRQTESHSHPVPYTDTLSRYIYIWTLIVTLFTSLTSNRCLFTDYKPCSGYLSWFWTYTRRNRSLILVKFNRIWILITLWITIKIRLDSTRFRIRFICD